MRKIIADTIYPISTAPIENGMLIIDAQNKIINLFSPFSEEYKSAEESAQKLKGIICPGFVNTHCHLELSYLKNKIEPGCGLIAFIQQLQQERNKYSENEIGAAIEANAKDMYASGTVGLGDICNGIATLDIKKLSQIYTHSFVELFGFDDKRANDLFNSGEQLYKQFLNAKLNASITPHAPYSCSKPLLALISTHCELNSKPLTIHNQESEEENKLFINKSGKIHEMLLNFGIDTSQWQPSTQNSLPSYFPLFSHKGNTLLVHNTFTSTADIVAVNSPRVYWCLCPNANLFIESQLPPIDKLQQQEVRLTIGTDSLASNASLSIWEELKTIRKHFPTIALEKLLKWATMNGALYLGIQNKYGSLEPGKSPGIVWIEEPEKSTSKSQKLA
jgi:cytosine/adenosine deaminase-related metal-dependent hydrolase